MLVTSYWILTTALQGKLDKSLVSSQGNQPGYVNPRRLEGAELGSELRSICHQNPMPFLVSLLILPFLGGWSSLMTQTNKVKSIHVLKTAGDRISRTHHPQEGLPHHLSSPQGKNCSCPLHAAPILTQNEQILNTKVGPAMLGGYLLTCLSLP